jgi:hypothetical protein
VCDERRFFMRRWESWEKKERKREKEVQLKKTQI